MTDTDPYALHLDHLKSLAAQPGWKAYAWNRAKDLAADPSGLWAGIDKDLAAAMAPKGAESQRTRPLGNAGKGQKRIQDALRVAG